MWHLSDVFCLRVVHVHVSVFQYMSACIRIYTCHSGFLYKTYVLLIVVCEQMFSTWCSMLNDTFHLFAMFILTVFSASLEWDNFVLIQVDLIASVKVFYY